MHGKAKSTSLSGPAAQGNGSPHEFNNPSADGQAQARATVFTGRRFVSLGKRPEHSLVLVFRYTHPGIAYRELKDQLAPLRLTTADGYLHLTMLGELDGVPDEVGQHLAQTGRITEQDSRDAWVNRVKALDALLIRAQGQGFHRVAEEIRE